MKSKFSKQEIQEKIREGFEKNPTKEEIKKIKKLASSKNIKIRDYKKIFCKKCYSLFTSKNSKIRIKNGFKTIKCNCGYLSKYKLK